MIWTVVQKNRTSYEISLGSNSHSPLFSQHLYTKHFINSEYHLDPSQIRSSVGCRVLTLMNLWDIYSNTYSLIFPPHSLKHITGAWNHSTICFFVSLQRNAARGYHIHFYQFILVAPPDQLLRYIKGESSVIAWLHSELSQNIMRKLQQRVA